MGRIISSIKQGRYGGSLLLIVLALFFIAFPQFASAYGVVLLTEVFIYIIFAMSLNLLIGYLGLPSLGHAAFFGVGGYTVAILIAKMGINNFGLCLTSALLATMIIGVILGFFAIRVRGIAFLMLTLALAQFLWAVVWSWRSLTGGDDGLPGVTRPSLGIPLSMWSEVNFYYLILIFFALAMFLLYRICHSPFGHILQGIRESETRMQTMGYNTWRYKYVAFVLAGVFGGLAGALKAYQDGFVSPLYPSVFTSGMVLLMCLVGGYRVFIGPALGAAVVWIIRSIVSSYTEYWSFTLGIILIVVVMFAPQGIGGYLMQLRGMMRRARTKG